MTDPADDLDPDDDPPPGRDDRLLGRLGAMFRATDPPPPGLVELAKQSFALRTLDAELARLVEDSSSAAAAGTRQAVAVRGSTTVPQPRQLTFQVVDERGRDEVIVAVQVEAAGDSRRLTGHLFPQEPAEIEVRGPAGTAHRVTADDRGMFAVDGVAPGPMSLTLRRPGAVPVATQWTLV